MSRITDTERGALQRRLLAEARELAEAHRAAERQSGRAEDCE